MRMTSSTKLGWATILQKLKPTSEKMWKWSLKTSGSCECFKVFAQGVEVEVSSLFFELTLKPKRISSKSINTSVTYSKTGHIYQRNYLMKKIISSAVNFFVSLNFPILCLIGHKTSTVNQTKSTALL